MKGIGRRLDALGSLNRWDDADKCLLVSGFTLPIVSTWIPRLYAISADPGTSAYVSRSFLPVMLAYQWIQSLGHLLIILVALRLRGRPSIPWLVNLEIQWWMLCFAFSLYALGPFTSPFGMLALLLPVAGLLIFDPRPMVYGLVSLGLYSAAMIGLERIGTIPYAPFLERPPFEDGRLVAGWILSIGVPAIFASIVVLALYVWVVVQWRRREAELELLTGTDPLTGIANRRVFFERLEHEVERARRHGTPVSVVMLDIDHFKRINDTEGHQAGDEALVQVARTLEGSVRSIDLLARYGGEEFALLLTETALPAAKNAADRCREAVSALGLEGKGGALPVTASFGVATLRSEEDLDGLLSRADRALYEAKEGGRDRVAVAA